MTSEAGTAAVETAFTVNDRAVRLDLDPRESLLDVLRERLGLTGAKKGCDHGQCGACTVHLDGRRVVSCLLPAVQVRGRDVTTIEGVSGPDGEIREYMSGNLCRCGAYTGILAAVRAATGQREG